MGGPSFSGKHEISVVVAVYNGGRFIEDALRSILLQTARPKEVVIVDDGSSDNSCAIVQEFIQANSNSAIQFELFVKKNGGQSSARNFGISKISGTLISFLDQDDVWEPDHLATALEEFDKDHSLVWTYTDFNLINMAGEVTLPSKLRHSGYKPPGHDFIELISRDLMMLPSASVIKTTAIRNVGGFDSQFIGYEDDDLFLRMFIAGGSFVYLPKVTVNYRVHAANSSGNETFSQSREKFFRKYRELIATQFPESPDYIWQGLAPRMTSSLLHEIFIAGRDSKWGPRQNSLNSLRELFKYRGWNLKRRLIFAIACSRRIFNIAYRALLKLRELSNRVATFRTESK